MIADSQQDAPTDIVELFKATQHDHALLRLQHAALQRTLDAMQRANRLVIEDRPGLMPPAELIAACLRDGLDALGELVGRITPDQVLEHVFARFCVGK